MLDTTEAAMIEANDFHDLSGVLLSSEKCDIPLTITHSMFISWAAANSPVSGKKKQMMILNKSTVSENLGQLIMLRIFLRSVVTEIYNLLSSIIIIYVPGTMII